MLKKQCAEGGGTARSWQFIVFVDDFKQYKKEVLEVLKLVEGYSAKSQQFSESRLGQLGEVRGGGSWSFAVDGTLLFTFIHTRARTHTHTIHAAGDEHTCVLYM